MSNDPLVVTRSRRPPRPNIKTMGMVSDDDLHVMQISSTTKAITCNKSIDKVMAEALRGLSEPREWTGTRDGRPFKFIEYPGDETIHGRYGRLVVTEETSFKGNFICPVCTFKEFVPIYHVVHQPKWDGTLGPPTSQPIETKTITGYECGCCSVKFSNPATFTTTRAQLSPIKTKGEKPDEQSLQGKG